MFQFDLEFCIHFLQITEVLNLIESIFFASVAVQRYAYASRPATFYNTIVF